MDLYLEFKPLADCYFSVFVDGDSTSGKYQTPSGGSTSGLTDIRIKAGVFCRMGLMVAPHQEAGYFSALAYLKELALSLDTSYYNYGSWNGPGDPALASRVYGKWCQMQSLDFSKRDGTLSWTNIRLIGMRRP